MVLPQSLQRRFWKYFTPLRLDLIFIPSFLRFVDPQNLHSMQSSQLATLNKFPPAKNINTRHINKLTIMKTGILSSKDLNKTGGMEQWVKDIQQALGCEVSQKQENWDFTIITDDIALWRADLSNPHLYYLTTPRRALYDMNNYAPSIYKPILPILRFADLWKIKQVNNIACISHTVKERIKKYYNRNATVIYPCVDTSLFHYEDPENYWLSVQRVDKWKRIELQLSVFEKLPDEKLVVVGPIHKRYKDIPHPKNVIFLGNIPKKDLIALYSKCKGVLCTSCNEDFGLVPLEAMASGKPVVAVNEGGYKETVIDRFTGRLVSPTVDGIIDGINTLPERCDPWCITTAERFNCVSFKKALQEFLK